MVTRLSYCNIDQKGTIVDIDGGAGAIENFISTGLNIGSEIFIQNRKNGKGKISVLSNREEVELGYDFASKILLECDEQLKITLDRIKVGDTVKVTKMGAQGDIRYRLLDMGLVRGVKLTVVRIAPLGDPIEVLINSFHLSLRLHEAENIEVEIVEINKSNDKGKKRWGIF